jgi:hypothetical protein
MHMTDILQRLAALTGKNQYGLPCPFCGDNGQPVLWRIGNEHTKERGCDVGCMECGFKKHVRVIRYSYDWAEERAKEAWNNRPRETSLIALAKEAAGEIGRLREALAFYADKNTYRCPTIETSDGQGMNYVKATNIEPIARDMFGGRAREALNPQRAAPRLIP